MPLDAPQSPGKPISFLARSLIILFVAGCFAFGGFASELLTAADRGGTFQPVWLPAERWLQSDPPHPSAGGQTPHAEPTSAQWPESNTDSRNSTSAEKRTRDAPNPPADVESRPTEHACTVSASEDQPVNQDAADAASADAAWADGRLADNGLEGDGNFQGGRPCFPRYYSYWPGGWGSFSGHLEARADYLLWWGKGDHVPALATTSPVGTPRGQAGVLGQSTASILFGDDDLNERARSGARVTLEYWLCADRCTAIEASFLALGDQQTDFAASSLGAPILARPFYNVAFNNTLSARQDASLVAFTSAAVPGILTGSLDITDTTSFRSAEILLRRNWLCNRGGRVDFLVGYRYARLADDLRINEFQMSQDPQGLLPVGTTLASSDRFQTLDEFNGAELGLLAQWHRCRWSGDFLAKLGLGNTRARVSIDGATVITEPDQNPATYQGGLLALPTNIGTRNRNQFSMIPELGATIGYELTCRLRFTVGYSLIYWSKVARPGGQIDTNLNQTQFPPNTLVGAAQPQFRYATTDFWAQGLNLGLDLRF
jgi:hypothetical protein